MYPAKIQGAGRCDQTAISRIYCPVTTNSGGLKRGPRCDVPNVFLKDLFSGRGVKLWDICLNKIAVIDFWLTKGRSDPPVSMDA
jgi:hypothetical protein